MKLACQLHYKESKLQLRDFGLKATPARLELLDVLKHAGGPLTVRQILAKIKGVLPDQVTLYRNMETLSYSGAVKVMRFTGRSSYYEIAGTHHHHLVCESCGKITELPGCRAARLEVEKVKNAGFASVKRHNLEYIGLCKKCAKN